MRLLCWIFGHDWMECSTFIPVGNGDLEWRNSLTCRRCGRIEIRGIVVDKLGFLAEKYLTVKYIG